MRHKGFGILPSALMRRRRCRKSACPPRGSSGRRGSLPRAPTTTRGRARMLACADRLREDDMREFTEETLTEAVVGRLARCEDPRFRQIMTTLIRHLHGFIREVE